MTRRAKQCDAKPLHAMQNEAMSRDTMRSHNTTCDAKRRLAMSCHVTQRETMAWRGAKQYEAKPRHAINAK